MTVRNVAAGARDHYLWFYAEQNGALVVAGGTPTVPGAGLSSGALEVLGVRSVAITVPETESVPIDGDDELLAEFEFDSIAARRYLIEVAVYDLQTEAYLQSTQVVQRAGGDFGVLDIQAAPELNIGLIHQSRAKKFDAANKGQKAWQGVMVPLATGRSLGRVDFTTRGAAVYRLSVVSQLSPYTAWGESMLDVWGTAAARQMPFRADYPYHLVAFTGDNSEDEVTLDHRPVNTARTKAWRSQGTELTVNSINRATRPFTATLSAAPATSAPVAVLYGYDQK